MEESVFDVLDELEYETSVNNTTDHFSLLSELQHASSKPLSRPVDGRQHYVGDQWPKAWENETDEIYSLDEFGRLSLRVV